MSRRSLDLIVSGGGVVLAVLLFVLYFVLADQASFSKAYVKDQLGQQRIVFTAADKLTEEEKTWQPGSSCLTAYAGQTMATGKQAECYANFFIKLHMTNSAKNAGLPGETYATLGGIQTQLRADIAAATQRGDTAAAADLNAKLTSATSLRTTMQTGETLRGLLLTSYGFSIFGEKAALAGTISLLGGVVLAVLAVAGFVHALVTPRETTVFATAPVAAGREPRATS